LIVAHWNFNVRVFGKELAGIQKLHIDFVFALNNINFLQILTEADDDM
jgi:hypothetical protein